MGVSLNPKTLRGMADNHLKHLGNEFANAIIPKIQQEMINKASNGSYELNISDTNVLNESKWLSKPHVYKCVIEKLRADGFEVSHCDDYKDGTYMIIKW